MGGKDLIIVLCIKEFHFGRCSLQAHHHGIDATAEEHQEGCKDIHNPDFLVVHSSKPFTPEIAPLLKVGQPDENPDGGKCDADHGSINQGFAVNLKFL
ncbi:hypothetical protein D3C75_546890 [compost metagenome]